MDIMNGALDHIQNIYAREVPHGFMMIHPENNITYICYKSEKWLPFTEKHAGSRVQSCDNDFIAQEHTPPSFYTQMNDSLPARKVGRPKKPKKNDNAQLPQRPKKNAFIEFFTKMMEERKITHPHENGLSPQQKMEIISQLWRERK